MARDRFDVEIRKAEIIEDGAAALVTLRVVVPEGANVLEALVTLGQDEAQGIAGFSPPTDGDRTRIEVRVPILDGELERGPAQISAFILLLNEDGTTRQAQDSEQVNLRGPRERDRDDLAALGALFDAEEDEAASAPPAFDEQTDAVAAFVTPVTPVPRLDDLRTSDDWLLASA